MSLTLRMASEIRWFCESTTLPLRRKVFSPAREESEIILGAEEAVTAAEMGEVIEEVDELTGLMLFKELLS